MAAEWWTAGIKCERLFELLGCLLELAGPMKGHPQQIRTETRFVLWISGEKFLG